MAPAVRPGKEDRLRAIRQVEAEAAEGAATRSPMGSLTEAEAEARVPLTGSTLSGAMAETAARSYESTRLLPMGSPAPSESLPWQGEDVGPMQCRPSMPTQEPVAVVVQPGSHLPVLRQPVTSEARGWTRVPHTAVEAEAEQTAQALQDRAPQAERAEPDSVSPSQSARRLSQPGVEVVLHRALRVREARAAGELVGSLTRMVATRRRTRAQAAEEAEEAPQSN